MAFYRYSSSILKRFITQSIRNLSLTEPRCIKRWVGPTLHELYKRRLKAGPVPLQPRSTYLEWNYDAEIFAFSKRLGEEFDDQLLRQALTHRSYVVQQNLKEDKGDNQETPDNSEFIVKGEKIIFDYLNGELKRKYSDALVKVIRGYLTTTDMLAKVAVYVGLKDIILCSDFPVEETTLADSFKAIVTALKLSSGTNRVQLFLKDFLISQLTGKDIIDDIWNIERPYEHLKDLLGNKDLEPRLCNESASNTILASYQVGLYSEKQLLGIGFGESIEIAKNTAAIDAIKKMYSSTISKQSSV